MARMVTLTQQLQQQGQPAMQLPQPPGEARPPQQAYELDKAVPVPASGLAGPAGLSLLFPAVSAPPPACMACYEDRAILSGSQELHRQQVAATSKPCQLACRAIWWSQNRAA